MKHPATCKICKRPMIVDISDDYDALGDPHKLLPMAAHDRCYDLAIRQRVLEGTIGRTCRSLEVHGANVPAKVRQQADLTLEKATKRYAKWMEETDGVRGYIWDRALVEMLLDHPGKWATILRDYRRTFNQE